MICYKKLHKLRYYNSFSLLTNIKFLHIFRGFPHVHCIEKISTKWYSKKLFYKTEAGCLGILRDTDCVILVVRKN